jgi:hypothetical protein
MSNPNRHPLLPGTPGPTPRPTLLFPPSANNFTNDRNFTNNFFQFFTPKELQQLLLSN